MGHIGVGCAEAIIKRWELMLGANQPITMFHDYWEASGYDRGVRIDLSQWAKHRPGALVAVYFVTRSKFVSMAITVASLTVPGLMTAFSKRDQFDILLKKSGLPSNRSLAARKASGC